MASSANAAQCALQPPFGNLPGELRNQIYEYVLLNAQTKVLPDPPVLPKAPHKPRHPYADRDVRQFKEDGTEPNRTAATIQLQQDTLRLCLTSTIE
jgi:hypothetical protein